MKQKIGYIAAGVVVAIAAIWVSTGGELFGQSASELGKSAGETESWVGSSLDQHAASVGDDQCLGWVDLKQAHADGTAKTDFSGWAWDVKPAVPPQAILLVESSKNIAGYAQPTIARPDVMKAVPAVTSDKVGWKTSIDSGSGEVKAYALLSSGNACPLGRTQ